MRVGLLMAWLALPSSARAQSTEAGAARTVTFRSPAGGERAGGRLSLRLALGPGVVSAGFRGDRGAVDLAGAAAVASLLAGVRVGSWVTLELGAAGALAIAPTVSQRDAAPTFGLEQVAGFALAGGGVAIGRESGVRASLLGGVAWLWAPIGGAGGARGGAGPGGGGFVELSHRWQLGARAGLELGLAGWAITGRDASGWIDASSSTRWTSFGGGLMAAVSAR